MTRRNAAALPAQSASEDPERPAPERGPSGRDAPEGRAHDAAEPPPPSRPTEIGGQAGPEPTRYGDWERRGRCTDF